MIGISGYIGVLHSDWNYYVQLSILDKLRYDLHSLQVAGYSGPIFNNPLYELRDHQIQDVKKRIKNEERKFKIEFLNSIQYE